MVVLPGFVPLVWAVPTPPVRAADEPAGLAVRVDTAADAPQAAVEPVAESPILVASKTARGEQSSLTPAADPVVEIEMSTLFVPLNANNTNGSPWKTLNGVPQVGLPQQRDLDYSSVLPADDPDPKSVTVRVTQGYRPNNVMAIGTNDFMQTDGDPQTGTGSVFFWKDARKNKADLCMPVVYNLINAPAVVTFTLEGRNQSSWEGDVFLTVNFATFAPDHTDERRTAARQAFTVTPVVNLFKVTAKNPSQVTLLKNQWGEVVGLNSGQQTGNGGAAGGGQYPGGPAVPGGGANNAGAIFQADLVPTTNMPGGPEFLQLASASNGNPSGATVAGVNRQFQRTDGADWPVVDSVGNFPFYPAIRAPDTPDHVGMLGEDTPYYSDSANPNASTWGGILTRVDMTFAAVLYLVWSHPDQSIYTLGTAAWGVVFRGSNGPNGWTVDPESVVSVGQKLLPDHTDPLKTVGGNYNQNWVWGWVP